MHLLLQQRDEALAVKKELLVLVGDTEVADGVRVVLRQWVSKQVGQWAPLVR